MDSPRKQSSKEEGASPYLGGNDQDVVKKLGNNEEAGNAFENLGETSAEGMNMVEKREVKQEVKEQQRQVKVTKTWKTGKVPVIYFANKDKLLISSTTDIFKKSEEEIEETLFNQVD